MFYGYELHEAYWDTVRHPKQVDFDKIYYIKDYEDDHIIFFNNEGKDLTENKKFLQVINVDGYIVGEDESGRHWIITNNGLNNYEYFA